MQTIVPVNGNQYKIRINSYSHGCSICVAEDAQIVDQVVSASFEKLNDEDLGAFHLYSEIPWWIDIRDTTILEEIV